MRNVLLLIVFAVAAQPASLKDDIEQISQNWYQVGFTCGQESMLKALGRPVVDAEAIAYLVIRGVADALRRQILLATISIVGALRHPAPGRAAWVKLVVSKDVPAFPGFGDREA